MSSEWKTASIDELKAPRNGSIAIGPFGSRMKSDCYVNDGVSVIRGTNLMGGRELSGEFVFITEEKAAELGNSNVLANDLVFPHRGSIGEVGIVPNDGNKYVLSSSLMKLSCDTSKVDPLFIYYFFKSSAGRFELLKNASQVGTPGIGQPLTSLKSIEMRYPRIETQKCIVGILTSLDDRITLLRETNTTLEAIAQALFKSWFVDFDPVRAKQEGREPEGMDADTAALFPDSFVESELGLMPKGWRVTNCQKIIDVRDGTHESPKPSQMGFPLITSRHITGGKINFDDTYLISEQDYENISKRSEVHRLDVLITMIGTVGLTVIVMEDKVEFAIKNIGLFKTSAVPHLCHYFYLLLSTNKMQQYLEARLAGTTQKYLSLKALREIAVLVPSESVLTGFSIIISTAFERIHQNNSKAQTLATLRDTLLPRLISGQLRLPDAEALIEEAAA